MTVVSIAGRHSGGTRRLEREPSRLPDARAPRPRCGCRPVRCSSAGAGRRTTMSAGTATTAHAVPSTAAWPSGPIRPPAAIGPANEANEENDIAVLRTRTAPATEDVCTRERIIGMSSGSRTPRPTPSGAMPSADPAKQHSTTVRGANRSPSRAGVPRDRTSAPMASASRTPSFRRVGRLLGRFVEPPRHPARVRARGRGPTGVPVGPLGEARKPWVRPSWSPRRSCRSGRCSPAPSGRSPGRWSPWRRRAPSGRR